MTDVINVNELSLLDAALHYANDRGWHVFPLMPGTKEPLPGSRGMDDATKDPEQIRAWWFFGNAAYNIGINCKLSGLLVVDPDRHTIDGVAAWESWKTGTGVELPSTWAVNTPGDGHHFYFSVPEDVDAPRGWLTKLVPGVDIKHNGYVVAAPSVSAGQGGRKWFARCLAAPVPMPTELIRAARRSEPPVRPSGLPVVLAAAPDVAARVRQLAAELQDAPENTGNDTATRIACMVGGYVGAGQLEYEEAREILCAALDGWTWAPGKPRSGMESTIERQLQFGMRSPRPWEATRSKFVPDVLSLNAPQTETPTLCTWDPVDLADVLNGTAVQVLPEIGWREDRVPLLYRGKEHSVAGEPESGKTWFALLLASQVLRVGGRVTYVDFEDDARTVVGRLLKLGVLADRLRDPARQFRYVRPEADVPPGKLAELLTFSDGVADLLVLDGYTEGAGAVGLDIMSQNDIALWRQKIVKPALTLGCATLVTDHVVKDKDSRGRYAIGAQHKLAGLTGVQFLIEVTETWGRGLKGRSRVIVTKDRNGGLRPKGKATSTPNHTHIGDLVGDATSGDMTSLVLWPPFEDKAADEWDGGLLAGKPGRELVKHLRPILTHVQASLEPLSSNDIAREVSGGKAVLLKALEWLSAADYVKYDLGLRGAKSYTITGQGAKWLVDHTGSTGSEPVLN